MDRAKLFRSLADATPSAEDIVYVARHGTDYSWHRVSPGEGQPASSVAADVWMYFSGAWPQADPVRLTAFCQDMLAEMESMAGGEDRCRWPLDQPWPLAH